MEPNYYTLKQLENYGFTNLKYRMIKYRFNDLVTANKIRVGDKIYKQKNKWFIHVSLIGNFQAKRKLKSHMQIVYENEITINLKDNYNSEYYHLMGYFLLQYLDPNQTLYRVEAGEKNGGYHIHLATTADYQYINHALSLLEDRLQIRIIGNSNTHISKIRHHTAYIDYINKAVIY